MEETHPLLQQAARLLPLTQPLDTSRGVMLHGAGLAEVDANLAARAPLSHLFLLFGAVILRWKAN